MVNMSQYKLWTSESTDYEFLKNVHHQTLKEHVSGIWGWDELEQDKFFSEDFQTGQLHLIEGSGKSVGYLQLNQSPSEIYIVNLLILPEFQNQGLGSQIIKDLIVKAKKMGQSLKLGVFKVNTRAKSLYSRLGFKTYEETKTHYLMCL